MQKMTLIRICSGGFLLFCFLFTQCTKTESIVCDGAAPTFSNDVQPIIQASCAISGCHGNGSRNGDYSSYAGLYAALVNGRFEREVLVNRTMPEGSRLSTSQLQTLQCWFDAGYADN